MTQSIPYHLQRLKVKFLTLRTAEVMLWAIGGAILGYAVCHILDASNFIKVGVAILSFLIITFIKVRQSGLLNVTAQKLISYINQQFPLMEESTDLLIKPENDLPLLQQIQRAKLIKRFDEIYPSITIPHQIGKATIIFLVCITSAFLLISFNTKSEHSASKSSLINSSNNKKQSAPLQDSIKSLDITIAPPSYTALKSYNTEQPELQVPENSIVTWNVGFSDKVEKAFLLFPSNDTLFLKSESKGYAISKKLIATSFYQIGWTFKNEASVSDFYKIEIITDQAPQITVGDLQQFTELTIQDKLTIDLKANLADDYGIKDSYVIATVSKGSGESVKFREEKLTFTSPVKIHGKKINASRKIDLVKLGLEPGDELYFYIEALDHRIPKSNRSRTETYFIALQDTASESMSMEAGLGVDLMPEYFRSQRQIIIDTEKLLNNKKKISEKEFKSTSNELGYDQKVLRLKYGEFLGEEFESGIGPAADHIVEESHDNDHDGEEDKEDPTKQYGHVHDTENEHNLVADKKNEQGHEHNHEANQDPDQKEDPMAAYMHVHDDPEEATFFSQSIRSKLKAALTVMWDAELHLRLFEPEKSLPYQYKALKLLKEISNDSRIYVHKTGFDPPPIKEEKRLSADLTEIKNSQQKSALILAPSYPAIRKALTSTEEILEQKDININSKFKNELLSAGQELAIVALEQPGKFLRGLSLIKAIDKDEVSVTELAATLREIKNFLWRALPPKTSLPDRKSQSVHNLDRSFIDNLETLNK